VVVKTSYIYGPIGFFRNSFLRRDWHGCEGFS